jgi:ankyrin repeat protein
LDHKDVAEVLLANNANVNATNSNDTTALHWAAVKGYKDMVELLRQHGGLNLGPGRREWP